MTRHIKVTDTEGNTAELTYEESRYPSRNRYDNDHSRLMDSEALHLVLLNNPIGDHYTVEFDNAEPEKYKHSYKSPREL